MMWALTDLVGGWRARDLLLIVLIATVLRG